MVNKYRRSWAYEPIFIARERALAAFDTLRDEISPLVANGDTVSLLKARQAAKRQQRDPKQTALNRRDMFKKVGEQARKALEEAQRLENTAAPPEVQAARDTRRSILERQGGRGPIPGVPRGVAEAQPSALRPDDRVYDSSATAPGDVIKRGLGAVNTPLVRGRGGPLEPLVEEATRPTNLLLGAAGPGLSATARGIPVVGRVAAPLVDSAVGGGLARRVIGEAAAAGAGRLGAEQLQRLIPEDAPMPVRAGAALAGGLLGGATGVGAVRGAERAGLKGAAESALDPMQARINEAVRRRWKPTVEFGRGVGEDLLDQSANIRSMQLGTAARRGGPSPEYLTEAGRREIAQPGDLDRSFGLAGAEQPTPEQVKALQDRIKREGMTPELRAEAESQFQRLLANDLNAESSAPTSARDVTVNLRRAREQDARRVTKQPRTVDEFIEQTQQNIQRLEKLRMAPRPPEGTVGASEDQYGSALETAYRDLDWLQGLKAQGIERPPTGGGAETGVPPLFGEAPPRPPRIPPTDTGATQPAFGGMEPPKSGRSPTGLLGDFVVDTLGALGNIKGALDFATGLRQAVTFTYRHPRAAFGKGGPFRSSARAYWSEDAMHQIQNELKAKPYAQWRDQFLTLTDIDGELGKNEEQFVSNWITKGKFNPIRRSAAAHSTMLNVARNELWEQMWNKYGAGPFNVPPPERMAAWAKLAEVSTGRGSVPKWLRETKIAGVSPLWAPSLLVSRLELPYEVIRPGVPMEVRKEAFSQIAAFVGVNVAALTMLDKTGVAEVEWDPRSADFGQIKIGDRRYDPWGGWRPIVNLAFRLQSGEGKSARTGDIYSRDRIDIVKDFLKSKLGPTGQAYQILSTGRDFTGKKLSPPEQALEIASMIFVKDLIDAFREDGLGGVAATIPSGFGPGVTNYEPAAIDQLSQEKYGVPYKQQTREQRQEFRRDYPQAIASFNEGLSGEAERAAKVTQQYRDQQQGRDDLLLSGGMTREQWLNQYDEARDKKAGEMRQIWGDKPVTDPKNGRDKYVQAIQQATDEKTGIVDWEQVDLKVNAMTQAERDDAEARAGLDETPVASLLRDVRKVYTERRALPKYRGFTGEEADKIDDLWQEVRNNARSAERADMSRAMRAYIRDNPGIDPRILRGLRRRVVSGLPQTTQRSRFDKQHPELKFFYGEGTLTRDERAAIQAMLAAKEAA